MKNQYNLHNNIVMVFWIVLFDKIKINLIIFNNNNF